MSGWWIADLYQQGESALLLSWLAWVIASIVLHELGHGFAAMWQGDNTPRDTGHITLNPIVHMGWFSLFALAIVGIAWGLMPVDPSRFRHRRKGWIIVAAAGPAVNLLLSGLCVLLCALAIRYGPQSEPLATNLQMFLMTGAWLNIYLMVFNLIPVPPLDGAKILEGFSDAAMRLFSKPAVQQFGFLAIFICFFWTTAASWLVDQIQTATAHAVGLVVSLLSVAL